MSNALVYTNVSVEAQITDETGAVTDTKVISLNDKISDLKVYDKDGNETTITGMVVSMPIVPVPNENKVPHACYHHEAAVLDGVVLQNKVDKSTVVFTNDMKDYYIPEIVIKDLTEGSDWYWTVQTNSIISIGEVTKIFHTVGSDGEYADITEAIAAAKEGDIIALANDIDLSTTPSSANTGAYNIPSGVNFDGQGHTITIDDTNWTGTVESPAGHVFSVAAGGRSVIQNVNIVGSKKAKAGIVCYGDGTEVALYNVNIKNCGTVAVQVSGATVEATNLTTSNSTWGAVNVDKGSDGSVPHFTLHSGDLSADTVEIYTEITDQDVIVAPAKFQKVVGIGTNLKGFVYYTTDVNKLGVATAVIDGVTYVY